MDIIHVSELSNKELFRTILNSLWIEYDHGGISVGRSYQASLIEGFMDFFTVSSHYRLLEGDLLRAAEMRIEEFSPYRPDWIQMEIPFSEMSVLSVEEFTLLSLRELGRWYDQESIDNGFYFEFPKKQARCMEKLFQIAYPGISEERLRCAEFDASSIVDEGRSRFRINNKKEERLRGFEDCGINPWTDYFQNF